MLVTRLDQILGEKNASKNFHSGKVFWGLFQYLEIPEQGAGTQGRGKYCRKVPKWILWTWKDEILAIIDIAP
jgi:hypothetical protein